jgi:hypothetical protein
VFDRHFQRAMRHGARLLFFIAVLLVLVGLVDGVEEVARSASHGGRDRATWLYQAKLFWNGLADGWPYLISATLRGLSSATLPLFGAVVVHRIDRWMTNRNAS